ncbi:hypothetical protein A3K63_05115 [Candidatus Micrarchaeota archaeon RBG_16_49_10]|nr:MAG: hypothetical protein A3K63_05115 [Candidatus Micrarchaeota archaeon RBG_16_49_10]
MAYDIRLGITFSIKYKLREVEAMITQWGFTYGHKTMKYPFPQHHKEPYTVANIRGDGPLTYIDLLGGCNATPEIISLVTGLLSSIGAELISSE